MADGLFNPSRLYEALAAKGMLPDRANRAPSNGQTGSYGTEVNRIMAPDKGTLAHEMVHATQYNLLIPTAEAIQKKRSNEEKLTPEEERFVDAMQKMYGESFGGLTNTKARKRGWANIEVSNAVRDKQLEALYYKGRKNKTDEDKYRTRRPELEAWGVEDMTGLGEAPPEFAVKGHLNPSMTTEFDILLSLYNQLPKGVQQDSAQARKDRIKKGRESGTQPDYYDYARFDSLLADPFPPTIK